MVILTILFILPSYLLASPSELERYEPVEYFNQGANTYEMMEKAKELTGLPVEKNETNKESDLEASTRLRKVSHFSFP